MDRKQTRDIQTTLQNSPEAYQNTEILQSVTNHVITEVYKKAKDIADQNYTPTTSIPLNHTQINDLFQQSLKTEAYRHAQKQFPQIPDDIIIQSITNNINENKYATIPPYKKRNSKPVNPDNFISNTAKALWQAYKESQKEEVNKKNKPDTEIDPKIQPLEYIEDQTLSQIEEEFPEYLKKHQSEIDKLDDNQKAIASDVLKNQLYLEKLYQQTKNYRQKYPTQTKAIKDLLTEHYNETKEKIKAGQRHIQDIAKANNTPNPTKTKYTKGVKIKAPPQLTKLQQELIAAGNDSQKIAQILGKEADQMIHIDPETIIDPVSKLTKNPIRYLDPKVIRYQYYRTVLNNASPEIVRKGHNPEIANLLIGTDSQAYLSSLVYFERQFSKSMTQDQINKHPLIIELREKYNRQLQAESTTVPQLASDMQKLYQDYPLNLENGIPQDGLRQPLPNEDSPQGNLVTYEETLANATSQIPRSDEEDITSSLSSIQKSSGYAKNGLNVLPNLGSSLSTAGGNYSGGQSNSQSQAPLTLTVNQAGTPTAMAVQPIAVQEFQERLNILSQAVPSKYRFDFRNKIKNRFIKNLANTQAAGLAKRAFKSTAFKTATKLIGWAGPIGRALKIGMQAINMLAHPSFVKFERFVKDNIFALGVGSVVFLLANVSLPVLLSAIAGIGVIAGINWLKGVFGSNPVAGAAHTFTHGSSVTSKPVSLTEAGGIDAIETTATYTNVSFMDIVTPGIPGASFFLTSIVGPFVLLFFVTFIVATHLLTAFSVPIPQKPKWGPFNFDRIPGYTPPDTGTTIPGTPNINPDVTQNCFAFQDPENNPTKTIIDQAATAGCIPSALLTALLSVESFRTLEYDAGQANEFDDPTWWTTANNGGNCYDATGYPNNTSAKCREGYCYNTCDEVRNGSPICPAYDVRGAGQFEHGTFYGAACTDSTPAGLQGLQGSCNAGMVPFIKGTKGESASYMPNRCRLSDNIFAAAGKIGRDSRLVQYGSDFSCTYNSAQWDPEAAKEGICKAAIAYCGSCGLVENLPDRGLPCEDYYVPGRGNANCGGAGSDGHCNMVYNRYVANLTSCVTP